MHPQHAIDALCALCEESASQESASQESGNTTEPECPSPLRMTEDRPGTKLTPTKFTLSGVKRKTSDALELIYENCSKKIRVPFMKGESEFVLHRRRNTLAQIALEEHLRVTAYCPWSNSLLSFRFNPVDWTLIHDTHQQQRYTFGTTQQIQLTVSRQTCAMSAFVTREQLCRSCAHPHWRAACEKPIFIRHISAVSNTRHHRSACVRHAWCDQTLASLGALAIDAIDLGPWRKSGAAEGRVWTAQMALPTDSTPPAPTAGAWVTISGSYAGKLAPSAQQPAAAAPWRLFDILVPYDPANTHMVPGASVRFPVVPGADGALAFTLPPFEPAAAVKRCFSFPAQLSKAGATQERVTINGMQVREPVASAPVASLAGAPAAAAGAAGAVASTAAGGADAGAAAEEEGAEEGAMSAFEYFPREY